MGQQPSYIVDKLAQLSVILCIIAEFNCNYAMCTTNYWYNVNETCLWNTALAIYIPVSLYLYS